MARQSTVLDFPDIVEKPKQKKAEAKKAKSLPQKKLGSEYVDFPEEALYGYLGDVARSMEGPLGWCFNAAAAVYAGMNSTCIDDNNPNSRYRTNIYVALLGKAGHGKSVAIDRAMQTLQPNEEQVETDTPASDRGIYKMFEMEEGAAPHLRCTTLVLDEMRDMLNKIAITGSSLSQVLCKLYNQDRAGSQDAKGRNRVYVRLSMVGGVMTEDISDFQSVFGVNTTSGFYTRVIFVPPPEKKFRWDFNWEPTMPPPPTNTKVKIMPEIKSRMAEWEAEYEALGYDPVRIAETTIRVGALMAAANGDKEITPACLEAMLAFASWQAEVKYGYRPGVAKNQDAELSADLLRTLKTYGFDEEGKPKKVLFSEIVRKRNWYRKYNPATVTRIKHALGQIGTIVVERENVGSKEIPRFEDTGYIWLSKDEF